MKLQKTQNTLQQSANNYDHLFRPPLLEKTMIDWIKSVLGITQMRDARNYRAAAAKDIVEIDRLLHLDGEDDWFANICRKENGEKACYPDQEK